MSGESRERPQLAGRTRQLGDPVSADHHGPDGHADTGDEQRRGRRRLPSIHRNVTPNVASTLRAFRNVNAISTTKVTVALQIPSPAALVRVHGTRLGPPPGPGSLGRRGGGRIYRRASSAMQHGHDIPFR
jgi:hypothetical protein